MLTCAMQRKKLRLCLRTETEEGGSGVGMHMHTYEGSALACSPSFNSNTKADSPAGAASALLTQAKRAAQVGQVQAVGQKEQRASGSVCCSTEEAAVCCTGMD